MTDNPFLDPDPRDPGAKPAAGDDARAARPRGSIFQDAGSGTAQAGSFGSQLSGSPGTGSPFGAARDPRTGTETGPAASISFAKFVAPAGEDAVLAAATPIFFLLGSIRTTFAHPDPSLLHSRAIAAMRRFVDDLRNANVAPETVQLASYILCASVDDAVLSTPWGQRSIFLAESMGAQFHGGVISGEKVFELLEDLKRDAVRNRSLLALIFVCISLGHLGQYAILPRGESEIESIRQNLYALLQRVMPAYELELSPHWRGESAPYRPGQAAIPLWVVFSVCAFVLLLAWGLVWWWLGDFADSATSQTFPPLQMPQLERPAEAVVRPLAPPPVQFQCPRNQTIGCAVAPAGGSSAWSVTLFDNNGVGLFESGSAELSPDLVTLLEQIGDEMKGKPWQVTVNGYTDNQPISGWRLGFRDNNELSQARAQAAVDVINAHMQQPGQVSAVGQGERDPLGDNASPEGRAQNRRIQIVVTYQPQNGN